MKKVIMEYIVDEYIIATRNYGKFSSAHEGFAVIKEEVDELWEAVRLKQSNPERDEKMRKEAIQVAAMACRFLHDIHGEQM